MTTPTEFEYWYKATVTAVYDGDSITVDMDLGFNLTQHKAKLRLYGIDTPELRGPDKIRGKAVRDYVRGLIPPGTRVALNTYRDRHGKYGRYLARVWIDGLCINDHLIEQGMAKEYMVR